MVSETVRLGPGKHTVVAVGDGKNVDLLVYRDNGVEPGKATLRAIHVAAEVGKADVRLDGKTVVTGVGLGDATDYLAVPPGRHSVAVTRPGGEGGALVKAQVRAVAGTASTAFVVGSAGMPAQVVLTEDGTAGPTAAPATGLGGATSDGGWLLIIGSSLIGGALGGTSYVLARRTRTRGALQVATPKPAAATPEPPAPSSVAAEAPAAPAPASVAAETPSEPASVAAETPATPASSSVAAGPPVKPDRQKAKKADEPKAEPPARPALPPMPPMPPLPRLPVLTPAPSVMTPAAEAPVANGVANGKHVTEHDAPEEAPATPAPALWTPPMGERWDGQAVRAGRFMRDQPITEPVTGGSRFVRPDAPAEPASAPPSYPRFVRHDPEVTPEAAPVAEATGAETVTEPPTPLIFKSPPVDAPEPDEPRPLSPWPETPAPEPYPPAPAAMPDPLPADPGSWTGSWIAEPPAAPESPVPYGPEPAPPENGAAPLAEAEAPVAETVEQPVPDVEQALEQPMPVADEAAEVVQDAEIVEDPEGVQADDAATVQDAELVEASAEVVDDEPQLEDNVADLTAEAPAPAEEPAPEAPVGTGVSTWSSSPAHPASASATAFSQKVNFLVVSGAALVVTGFVVARRSGRH